jgi:hypothetical protein
VEALKFNFPSNLTVRWFIDTGFVRVPVGMASAPDINGGFIFPIGVFGPEHFVEIIFTILIHRFKASAGFSGSGRLA